MIINNLIYNPEFRTNLQVLKKSEKEDMIIGKHTVYKDQ